MYPKIEFSQLEQKIKDEDVILKQPPEIEDPTLLLEREVRLTPEFNLKQLRILAQMLSVEEWEDAASFKINWINTNPNLPLKRFVLFYNQKKQVLKKKYVYRGKREALIEQKENIFKQKLIGSAQRKDASILGEGFK
ncbi:hypothetical protein [Niallia endozanthoxylica]|uniref:Uncharacterized protein n=1 Tax=Niallia endozanthoxylica TaxID=2036016 RepID=A0A5J5HYC6_9BACI|nr:hypothetical protein [Niallia endozanthoxylica]KAA9026945.1 hypothetical protein F4V44_06395 [Niallia endozanthoxylica]